MIESELIEELSVEQCWSQLEATSFGRLVVHIGKRIEVFPVNIVATAPHIVFRTAGGTKLFAAAIDDELAFQCDGYTDAAGWSIVAHGRAHLLETDDELYWAEHLGLRPWVPTIKPRFVRIDVTELTGRRFRFGPDPN